MTQNMTGPTPDDIETFGQDLVEFSQRAATPIVDQRVGHLEQQISEVRASQQRQQLQANRDHVMRALDADPEIGSTWRAQNDDAAFIRWLSQRDPLSGERLQDLLIRAFNSGSGERCAHIFKGFIAQRRPARQRTEHRQTFEPGRRQPSVTVKDAVPRRGAGDPRSLRRGHSGSDLKWFD